MLAATTDFSPAPQPARSPWGPGVGVGGALFATFALGFTEGCLEVGRRPIPLPFALRFAAANVLPSAVWSSVPARHVAAASGVPLSALVSDAEVAGPRSVAVGKRLVLIKSVRALRLAAGSYGLAWSLWRVHSHGTFSSNNSTEQATPLGERVVRLAPVNSPLSRASRRAHGDQHFVTVPVSKESRKHQTVDREMETVDWEKVGIQVQVGAENAERTKVKVIEVELSDAEATVALAGKLRAKAARDDSSVLCSVAVLPPCGPPLPTSITDSFDVCFNPLSAVLTFIASVCYDRGIARVVLVVDEQDGSEALAGVDSLHISASQLVAGLLYRHGISATVLKPQQVDPVDEQVEGQVKTDYQADSGSQVVFFVSKCLETGRCTARRLVEHGLVTQQNACFIVDESLRGQNVPNGELQAQSALLARADSKEVDGYDAVEGQEECEADDQGPVVTYLSVADVSDQTLQGIRTLLRQGQKPEVIQAALYQAYGTQRVVAPQRCDQFSDMNV
ncbi:hypothetical protein PR003_g27038 [Phytophthora rubi]|uniref:Uncharacterized protein n=1 Tax=Phytophthora rubi TaxID=129364 RepID=A0A6A3I2T1_9STRA|nr:hypothetical protein PR001_g25218 [Phytophthora rubi]KAE9283761.1 hypothetical protein PR003_g27038 [Phytophthora rubi]